MNWTVILVAQAVLTIASAAVLYRLLRNKLQALRTVMDDLRSRQKEIIAKIRKVRTEPRIASNAASAPAAPATPAQRPPAKPGDIVTLTIDAKASTLTQVKADGTSSTGPLFSPESYERISDQWLRVGWGLGSWYTFTWFGRPILSLPEDLIRMQEVIYALQPDYVVETGVAHGGSLVFYASLFEALGKGRIIGIDIKILPEDIEAIRNHPLSKRIEFMIGSSTDPANVSNIKGRIPAGSKVLVVLDSDHSKAHVAAELEAYHDMVTPGSYIVATDGIISLFHDIPGTGQPEWVHDNATEAAREFAARHPEFVIEQPAWAQNRSLGLQHNVTHWPGAWLKRLN
jgi:cephalosporin hydroxylase